MSATTPFARILSERAALVVVVVAGAEDEPLEVEVVAGEPDGGERLELEPLVATEVPDNVVETVGKRVAEVVVVVGVVADVVETDVAVVVVTEVAEAVVIGPGPRLNI
jgi:hypothetical protein